MRWRGTSGVDGGSSDRRYLSASRPSNIGQCRQWKDIVDRTTHHPLLMFLAYNALARDIRSGWWVVRSTISFHWRHCPMFDGLDAVSSRLLRVMSLRRRSVPDRGTRNGRANHFGRFFIETPR